MAAATATPPAVRLLGPIEVVGPHGPAQLVGARQRGLVALLALNAGTIVPQSRLVDALWGEDPPRTAVRSLHSHVSRVRQALQTSGLGDVLRTREPGYLLTVPRDEVDVHRFEGAVRGTGTTGADGVERLRAALLLWRGDPLADGEPAGWAVAEVERLQELRLAALEQLWDAELKLGRHAAALAELERELVAAPGRERLVGLLMLALYRCGRHADALDRYERLRAKLADELGVDPGPQLQRLHTAILRRDPTLDLTPEPAGQASEPERQTQAYGASGGADSRHTPAFGDRGGRAPAAAPAPAQLPPPAGHFAGRGEELAALDRRAGADIRIVVVSGPGGIGKTALAVQWAHQARTRFPDGQLFLDLRGHDPDAALTPGEALTHALRSLGVPADRIPANLTEQTALYRSLVHDLRLLVMLDNGGTADHVLPLVPSGEASLLVVTSRHQLAALTIHHGVHAVQLDVLAPDEALSLLRRVLSPDRVDREADAAARLVELCGRMPLALRIAAAKLAARPRQDIADLADELAGGDRLDALRVEGDARSVRNVFASAYDALSEPAARLFRLLALHPGPSFTTHLAAALTGLSYGRVRRSVDELAAAHLITEIASGRYRFHDLVRLFARECAEAEESAEQRAEAAGRIVDWYLDVADAANRTLDPARDRVRRAAREVPFPAEPAAILAFLDGEHDNLTAVVEHAARSGLDDSAWQLTYLLAGYFESRGHWADRVAMGQWGLHAAQRLGDAGVEGLMRSGLGVACIAARRFDDALEHLHHALALMRATGDKRGEGHAYNNIAAAYAELRRFDEAVDAFGSALALHTANGHRAGTALALNNLGYLYGVLGKVEDGLAHLERGLALASEDGNSRVTAAILHSLGQTHRLGGNHRAALEYFDRAVDARRQQGERRYEAGILNEIGLAHLLGEDLDAALASFGSARALCQQIGDQHLEAIAVANIGRTRLLAGDLTAARDELERALTMRTHIPDWYEEANVHRSLGELQQRCGDPEAAAAHWRRAVELYEKVNATTEANQLSARSSR